MTQAVLELADVTFRRDGKQIIDGISLTVHPGEHWALLGPNGAGKSTLLGFCAAVTFPTTGTVRVLGEQMGRVDLARLRHSIGHVNPRHRLQYSLTVREVVLTGITATIDIPMRWTPSQDDLERADAMIASVGLGRRFRRSLDHAVAGRTRPHTHCASPDLGSPTVASRRAHDGAGRGRPRTVPGDDGLARRHAP